MTKSETRCRHNIPHSISCSSCKNEDDRLNAFRVDERRRNAAVVAKARELGRPYTVTDVDGCEVTAEPDGNIFFNASDWW